MNVFKNSSAFISILYNTEFLLLLYGIDSLFKDLKFELSKDVIIIWKTIISKNNEGKY